MPKPRLQRCESMGKSRPPRRSVRCNREGNVVSVRFRAWLTAEVLGKVLTALGLALERDSHAGMSDAIELLAGSGWRRLIRGMTPERLAELGARVARRYPDLVAAADLVRRSKRFRPGPASVEPESFPESSQET